eukprot:scpid36325/ scgid5088/ 
MDIPEHLLEPLEGAIRTKLIPALTCRSPPGGDLRRVFALPCRLGGLGITSPMSLCGQYNSSVRITEPLTSKILSGDTALDDCSTKMRKMKAEVKADCESLVKGRQRQWRTWSRFQNASASLRNVIDIAREKGSSSWLTCRPLKKYGFSLTKQEFWDGLCLRYGWTPARIPTHCSCGQEVSVSHSLSCPHGGFPTIRHNAIRDTTAQLLHQVCSNVSTEPTLQPRNDW